MSQLRLCLHTQTPLIRFLHEPKVIGSSLADYQEGTDYVRSPGGVTRMMQAFLSRLTADGRLRHARWVSLSPIGPRAVALPPVPSTRPNEPSGHIVLEHVHLPPADLSAYAQAKSNLWNAIHDIALADEPPLDIRETDRGLRLLCDAFGARSRELHDMEPFDAFYTHDFQLLPLAKHLPVDVPRLFRWHIPAPPAGSDAMAYTIDHLNAYDRIVVSTRAIARAFQQAGVQVPIHTARPYIDERRERVVTAERTVRFDRQWKLKVDDALFVVVARMDAMKRQDVAIRALARIRDAAPHAKLMLVGGGGFSGGKRGGLGLDASTEWRGHCEDLAHAQGVADRVIFAGALADEEVDVALTRSCAVLLPSSVEGFGLAAAEGWLYGRPALVSTGAGISEMVRPGEDGFTFEPGDDEALARAMLTLALSPIQVKAMGASGRRRVRELYVEHASEPVWQLLRVLARARDAKNTRTSRR